MDEPEGHTYRGCTVFSHNQDPALTLSSTMAFRTSMAGTGKKGDQFEYGERRRQVCSDPIDTDC